MSKNPKESPSAKALSKAEIRAKAARIVEIPLQVQSPQSGLTFTPYVLLRQGTTAVGRITISGDGVTSRVMFDKRWIENQESLAGTQLVGYAIGLALAGVDLYDLFGENKRIQDSSHKNPETGYWPTIGTIKPTIDTRGEIVVVLDLVEFDASRLKPSQNGDMATAVIINQERKKARTELRNAQTQNLPQAAAVEPQAAVQATVQTTAPAPAAPEMPINPVAEEELTEDQLVAQLLSAGPNTARVTDSQPVRRRRQVGGASTRS